MQIAYAKEKAQVGDQVEVLATLTNQTGESAPMVLLELPVPAGFAILEEDFERQRTAGKIAKYEVEPGKVVVYLRSLQPNETWTLPYRVQANLAVRITVPAGRAYEYYNPDRQARSQPTLLTVSAR